jgi:hypothetical protein
VVIRFTAAGNDIAQCLVSVDGKLYAGTGGSGVWSETITPAAPAAQTVFTDVPGSYWAYGDIEKLSGSGYIEGYPDGTFKPDAAITRAESVAVLDKALNIQVSNWASISRFSDVSPSDWFFGSVGESVYAGIAKGYGSDFSPNISITRQELAVMLVSALNQQNEAMACMHNQTGFSDDAQLSSWARGFVVIAVKDGLIKGYPDGAFGPQMSTTRAEACVAVSKLLQNNK